MALTVLDRKHLKAATMIHLFTSLNGWLLLMAMWLAISVNAANAQGNSAGDGGAEAYTIAEIKRVWQERQNKTQTAKFEWTEEHFWPTDTVDAVSSSSGEAFPAANTTWLQSCMLAFDGIKARFELHGTPPSASGKQVTRDHTMIFDGKVRASVDGPNQLIDDHSQGVIHRPGDYADMQDVTVLPVVYSIRPLESTVRGIDLSKYAIVDDDAHLSPTERCVLLRQQGNWPRELWLSPEEDFSVRRYVSIRPDGSISIQVDIDHTYVPDPGVWVPASWRIVSAAPNPALQRSTTADVTKQQINSILPASDFEISFPTGALVFDGSKGGRNEMFIQRADGTRREVLREEIAAGQGYQQLVNTETGDVFERQLGGRSWILITVIAGAVAAIAAAAFWLKRRTSEKASLS